MLIKISHPSDWLKNGHWHFDNLTEDAQGGWGLYKFEVGKVRSADFWIVYGDLDHRETILCHPENVIYITSEEKTQVESYHQKFLDQFGLVITSRDDIQHKKVMRNHYLCPWQVKKTYQELKEIKSVAKNRDLSAVISSLTWLDGHKKRYAFINKLKGHFKDKLDWFAKGEAFIENKWDGLAQYKYSIAIENSSHPYYWTEKLMDCYLAYTMPIYWGCPNLVEYFPEKSFIQIDMEDYKKSIQVIEQAIEENLYEKNYKDLQKARELVLNQYQFIPALIQILEKWAHFFNHSEKKNKITLRSESYFKRQSILKKTIKRLKNFNQ